MWALQTTPTIDSFTERSDCSLLRGYRVGRWCYRKLDGQSESYDDALRRCKNWNQNAVLFNPPLPAYARKLIADSIDRPDRVWTGAKDDDTEGTWVWDDPFVVATILADQHDKDCAVWKTVYLNFEAVPCVVDAANAADVLCQFESK